MRITLFLLLVSFLQTFANDTYSQVTKLSLNFSDTKLSDALDEIENLSEFYFLFNEKLIDTDRKVTLSANNKKIDKILNELFSGTDVIYTITDRKIILAPSFLSESVAQQKAITGTVTDESGQPLPGVTVVVKGTTHGTVTDVDGNYSISGIPENATLLFSFVGMRSQEVVVGTQTSIDITMLVDAIGLEEVIAVGYGTMKKSDVTSAIAKVDGEDIRNRITPRLDDALQGQLSGVSVQQTSGVPGNAPLIRIRGISSITSGNQPLYVIDGFPVEDNSVIGRINMNDVESVEVLKDASSSAIYGSRGSNGVVLITTKKGKSGNATVNFGLYYGIQSTEKRMDFLDGNELGQMMTELRNYYWVKNGGNESDPNDVRPANRRIDPQWASGNQPTYDNHDFLFHNAPIQNYSLSISGGNYKTTYFSSLDYFDQEGIVKGTNYKRYSARTNVESQVNDRVKIGVMLSPSYSEQIDHNTEGKDQNMNHILLTSNLSPIGDFYYDYEKNHIVDDYYSYYNDVGSYYGKSFYKFERAPDLRKYIQIISNSFIDIKILEGLKFRSSLGLLYSGTDREQFIDFETGTGTIQKYLWNSNTTSWLWENTLNYSKTIKKHSFTFLAGYTSQKEHYKSTFMSGRGFPNDLSETINNATEISKWDENRYEWSLISMLARATYNFDDRYLFTGSIRRDGSSRFGSNNKWGVFPSASVAWRVSEEAFFTENNVITDLKLRASWGETGNNRIGNYSSMALLRVANTPLGVNEDTYAGLVPSSPENQDLGWEKTTATNIGLDISFFKNRLNLNLEVYKNITSDLLLNVPIPLVTGFETQLRNIGEVSNKGFEMDIYSRNLIHKFKWNTRFNFSSNKNEVLSLGENDASIITGEWYARSSYTGIGYPIGAFYMHEQEGIFQNQEEVDNSARWKNEGVGDVKLRDINGDGKVDNDDRNFVGQPFPKWNIGMTNEFKYKNFDLSIFLNAAGGHKTFFIGGRYYDSPKFNVFLHNFTDNWANRWRSEDNPGDGRTPRITSSAAVNQMPTTRWLYDSDWFRVKNVTFGYTLPKIVTSRLKMASLRLYASADNLLLATKYPGYNPEGVSIRGESAYQSAGYDYSVYPLAKKIVFGLNVTF